MRSTDQINVVLLVEGGDNLLTKSKADSSVIFSPSLDVLIRIRPKEITQETGIRDIGRSHDPLDLFKGAQLW
jgi:hypothetical protein